MLRYAIIIEKTTDGGFCAYVPDLPGCVGMGDTHEDVMNNIAEAIQFHIEGMKAEGIPVPPPNAEAENLIIAVA